MDCLLWQHGAKSYRISFARSMGSRCLAEAGKTPTPSAVAEPRTGATETVQQLPGGRGNRAFFSCCTRWWTSRGGWSIEGWTIFRGTARGSGRRVSRRSVRSSAEFPTFSWSARRVSPWLFLLCYKLPGLFVHLALSLGCIGQVNEQQCDWHPWSRYSLSLGNPKQ